MTALSLSVHTARNSGPILALLQHEFRGVESVLEIASGNGQHATTFAAELRDLVWQTSDLEDNHKIINQWLDSMSVTNVLPPLSLDVRTATLPHASYGGVFSANSAHIMSASAVSKMFELVAKALQMDGVFCLYGPFRQNGEFNSESNAAFHTSLRTRNAEMGIRHLEQLDGFAITGGLVRRRLFAMPANNHLVVWQKTEEQEHGNT
jgi:hypothetical protein